MGLESERIFQKDNLVLYKSHPARVIQVGIKIEIELPDKKSVQVRNKDITLLHPGPIASLAQLEELIGEVEEACSMLYGQNSSLTELSELIYGSYTPSSAWCVYKLLSEGLFICGSLDQIRVRTQEDYRKELQSRIKKASDKEVWQAFIERLRKNEIIEEDKNRLNELGDFALGKSNNCRILRELEIQPTVENAHTLLLKLRFWDCTVNPHIQRLGFTTAITYPSLDPVSQSERMDLTRLQAFAIDDEGNKDPDDAISIEGNTLWVHVADVASLVKPDSGADIHARTHASTLYLPEQTVPMLPQEATDMLGLGLHETSPALSFAVTVNENGAVDHVEIHPSLVKVTRLTYAGAQRMLDTPPLKEIHAVTQRYKKFRKSQNAINLTFPEVKIRVENGRVLIKRLPELDTQDLVTDAMLMAGEAAAQFAIANAIPFPFTTQPPPETIEHPTDMAAMFAYRRHLKPGIVKCSPDLHAGLGLKAYSRVTSPLRRYLDLIAHQQLRAFITKQPVLDEQEIMNRIGLSAAMVGTVQKLERASNLHWTLVYLLQNPDWQGSGVVVEKRDRYYIVLIPEIALETRIAVSKQLALNEEIRLRLTGIDLPSLIAHFAVI